MFRKFGLKTQIPEISALAYGWYKISDLHLLTAAVRLHRRGVEAKLIVGDRRSPPDPVLLRSQPDEPDTHLVYETSGTKTSDDGLHHFDRWIPGSPLQIPTYL
jgi:hypothetical protein